MINEEVIIKPMPLPTARNAIKVAVSIANL
jgi:hypothetical protein